MPSHPGLAARVGSAAHGHHSRTARAPRCRRRRRRPCRVGRRSRAAGGRSCGDGARGRRWGRGSGTHRCRRGLPARSWLPGVAHRLPGGAPQVDLAALRPCAFDPGSMVWLGKRMYSLGDPTRRPAMLLSSALAPVGSLTDKVRLAGLLHRLRKADPVALLRGDDVSTLTALRDIGFSTRMIDRFFRPLLGGIQLDVHLTASRRMADVILRCLAKARDDRYPSADALAQALRAADQGLAHGAVELPGGGRCPRCGAPGRRPRGTGALRGRRDGGPGRRAAAARAPCRCAGIAEGVVRVVRGGGPAGVAEADRARRHARRPGAERCCDEQRVTSLRADGPGAHRRRLPCRRRRSGAATRSSTASPTRNLRSRPSVECRWAMACSCAATTATRRPSRVLCSVGDAPPKQCSPVSPPCRPSRGLAVRRAQATS